jgi:deoxyhypusine monooxygenase
MTISVDAIEDLSAPRLTEAQIAEAMPSLRASVLNATGKHSLDARFRALFTLKSIGTSEAISTLALAFSDSSALFKHEAAYILGQIGNPEAIDALEAVLADPLQDPMVRHEAGEALGAIASPKCIALLKSFMNDPAAPVRETCELAIARIEHYAPGGLAERETAQPQKRAPGEIFFESVDPAPAFIELYSVPELESIMTDCSRTMFDRYRAMFSLRNRATPEAIEALCRGLKDESSALFRHEVAYVLGQLQSPASVEALSAVLGNTQEIDMVRHECAEAIGSVATAECKEILEKYINDPAQAVRESCIVALDIFSYENDANAFQYANFIKE